MGLLDARASFQPYEYEQFFKYWEMQQSAHWLPSEINLSSDIEDFKFKLTPAEKNVVINILKGFTATEVFILEYWSNKVNKWFKKPEIQMMGSCFSNMESIHAVSYFLLESSLGLTDMTGFLSEPTAKAKIDRLINTKGNSISEIALSLAVFSAFNEGVNLFGSFITLMSFSRRNLLKGVGKISEFSSRDESIHAKAGCELFSILVKENPHIMTDDFKKEVYEAARLTVQLEDAFIDKAFEMGPLEDLDPKDIKNYIRYRANNQLNELGLKSNWKNIDKDSLERLGWFDLICKGMINQDFFAGRTSDYSKGVAIFDDI